MILLIHLFDLGVLMDKVGHVAAAPGLLACPGRGARPPSLSFPQRSAIYPVLDAALGPDSVFNKT